MMSTVYAIEGFLSELYPVEYGIASFESTEIATESFVGKAKELISRLIAWIKKVVASIGSKIKQLISRFKKPPKIVGKDRKEPATEEWVEPAELMCPKSIVNSMANAIHAIDSMMTLSSISVSAYIKSLSEGIGNSDALLNSDDESKYEAISKGVGHNEYGDHNTLSKMEPYIESARNALDEVKDFEMTSSVSFETIGAVSQMVGKSFYQLEEATEEVTKVIDKCNNEYSESKLTSYFQRLYSSVEDTSSVNNMVNERINLIHKRIATVLSGANQLLNKLNTAYGILSQFVTLVNKYSR